MYSYYLLIRRGIIRRNKIQVWPTQRGSQLLNLAPCPQNVFMQVILEQTHAVISEWKTPDSKTNSKKKKKRENVLRGLRANLDCGSKPRGTMRMDAVLEWLRGWGGWLEL